MRALLIHPEYPLSFWSFEKSCRLRGNKTVGPPLGLITVAALLPADWDLRLVDLNASSLTEDDWQWAEVVLLSAMYIQRDSLLALVKEAKLRGKTVVAGGPYPTSLPEAVLEAGGDFVVRGEGENTMSLLLEAMEQGKTGIIENPDKPDLSTSPIPRPWTGSGPSSIACRGTTAPTASSSMREMWSRFIATCWQRRARSGGAR